MCPQIKSIYFLELWPKNESKRPINGPKMLWFGMVWLGKVLGPGSIQALLNWKKILNAPYSEFQNSSLSHRNQTLNFAIFDNLRKKFWFQP